MTVHHDVRAAPSPPAVHVAEAALLRVAEWPLATLESLSCPQLRATARSDGTEGAAAYEETVAVQRDVLATLTTTAAFDRALTLANPIVAQRWRTGSGRARSGKARDRRLEATVVRYLCRATGRATPHGAWAGVAEVRDAGREAPGDGGGQGEGGLRVVPAGGQWWVSPSVAPFQQLCGWIGRTEAYLHEGRFQLEATLQRQDGRWQLLGPRGWRTLPDHPVLDLIVSWWQAGDAGAGLPLGPFVSAAAGDDQAGQLLWQAARGLRDAGVLVASLRVPSVGRGPRAGLELVVDELPAGMRPAWRAALCELDRHCEDLAMQFQDLTGAQLSSRLSAAQRTIETLWRACGTPGAPPQGPPLRIDRAAPFRACWDGRARSTVARAVEDMLAIWAADGTAELYRRGHLSVLADGPLRALLDRWTSTPMAGAAARITGTPAEAPPRERDGRGPHTRASIFREHFGVDQVFDVEARWVALASGRHHPATVTATPLALAGPWSVPLGHLPACGSHLVVADGERLHLEWGRPQPGLFVGRHHQLTVATATVAAFAEAMASMGLEVVDVHPRDVLAHDAAQRTTDTPILDLRDPGLVAHAAVALGDHVAVTVGPRRLLCTTNSAAATSGLDPLSAIAQELVNANGWELLSFRLPLLEHELVQETTAAAVVTARGHVLRRRRRVVGPAWARTAVELSGWERYRHWARLVDDTGLGELVSVEVGDEPPLLLPASSPLAVEAFLSWLPSPAPGFLLSEPAPATLVIGPDGERYVAELAVSWWRV